MTTPENPDQLPERLIAFRPKRSPLALAPHGPMFAAEEQRPGDRPTCAEEKAYVREDVAEAAVKAAEKETARQCSSAMYDVEDERDALRRERDALQAEKEAMVKRLGERATFWESQSEKMSGQDGAWSLLKRGHAEGLREAIAAVAAGKGVG